MFMIDGVYLEVYIIMKHLIEVIAIQRNNELFD